MPSNLAASRTPISSGSVTRSSRPLSPPKCRFSQAFLVLHSTNIACFGQICLPNIEIVYTDAMRTKGDFESPPEELEPEDLDREALEKLTTQVMGLDPLPAVAELDR